MDKNKILTISGVKKAIFDRLCKQLENIGQQINSEYSYFKNVSFEKLSSLIFSNLQNGCLLNSIFNVNQINF